MDNFKIGCCGFAASRQKYFNAFDVVELQVTFYQPPSLRTAERWRLEAPANFEYTMKAWQLITHDPSSPTYKRLSKKITASPKDRYGFFRPTDEVLNAWETTQAIAHALAAKIIIFQCPASFAPTRENKINLSHFFDSIDRGTFLFVWEPRGGWSDEEVERLCKELSLIRCHTGKPPRSHPGELIYVRLHGDEGYRYKYSDEDLKKIIDSYKCSVPSYIMFNNISMFDDALRMKKLLEAAAPRA